jgi:8-oxo-dGTP pyrophosphatase MutT (NUDIX family)
MELKAFLSKELANNLPGEQAHAEMAPTNRPLSSFARSTSADYRESAVSIIFQANTLATDILLIQRPSYNGVHGGQVSFPGGKRDPEDKNLFYTAIRECREEIGVNLSEDQFIGLLTPVFIPISKFDVLPHVFVLENEVEFTPDEREVESIFSINVEALLEEKHRKKVSIPNQNGTTLRNIPCFEINNKIIWGATALMLNELRLILQKIH